MAFATIRLLTNGRKFIETFFERFPQTIDGRGGISDENRVGVKQHFARVGIDDSNLHH